MGSIAKIQTRPLGKNGPEVPRMGLGLVNASEVYGKERLSEAERLGFFTSVYEQGETFWDTADEYGDSEDLLGKWFAANPEKRDNVFLATKFGVKALGGGKHTVDSTPEYCKQAIEKSLKRLGLPYVDLFYVHRLDKVTPIEKTMETMVELKKAGKIKHIGLSECSADSLRRAHAVAPITAVQVEYSAFCVAIEEENNQVLKTARELGVAVVAYTPLGYGVLTGNIRSREDVMKDRDLRVALPWLKEENIAKNAAVLEELSALAKSKSISPAQLALAWVLAQGDDIFPIPGTTKAHRMAENLNSLDISLSAEEEKKIRDIAKGIVGGRIQAMHGYDFADTPPL